MPRFDRPLEELETYRPDLVEPEDLDEFWDQTLAENAFDPSGVTRVKVESPLTLVDVWDVTFPGFGGAPIKAWYIVPAGASGPLPTIVQFQGYGGGRGHGVDHLEWASCGYAHLFMDSRGQGGTWGSGGDTPDPGGSSSADQGFMTRGITDPRDHYYRRLFVDAHHAIEAAATMPETDSEKIIAHGISQGGGLAIAATALNPRVRAAMPDVPFLCHIRHATAMTEGTPYDELARYLSVYRDRVETVFGTMAYFDGAILAKRAKVPALFSTALLDTTCPPSTVFAARNNWAGGGQTADIKVYEYNGHEGGQAYQWAAQNEWLTTLLEDVS